MFFFQNFSEDIAFYNTVSNYQSILLLGLQMTDVELDERVTALEENGGSGDTQNGRKKIFILWLLCSVSK